jgi:hypothetical protein
LGGESRFNVYDNDEIHDPVPIAGLGLPGMLFLLASGGLLGWWRRRQKIALRVLRNPHVVCGSQ